MVTKSVRLGADNCGRQKACARWEEPTRGAVVVVYCKASWANPGGNRSEAREEGEESEDVEAVKTSDDGNRSGDRGAAVERSGAAVVAARGAKEKP